jgi:hypothetical protein
MIIAPRWRFYLGVVRPWAGWLVATAGILALASIAFFPQTAIGLWILVVSGLLFARAPGRANSHRGRGALAL